MTRVIQDSYKGPDNCTRDEVNNAVLEKDPSGIEGWITSTIRSPVILERAATALQPTPVGQGTPITQKIVEDLLERSRIGTEKYGTCLRANNGRDALVDAYQEAIDLCQYLRQAIEERDVKS